MVDNEIMTDEDHEHGKGTTDDNGIDQPSEGVHPLPTILKPSLRQTILNVSSSVSLPFLNILIHIFLPIHGVVREGVYITLRIVEILRMILSFLLILLILLRQHG